MAAHSDVNFYQSAQTVVCGFFHSIPVDQALDVSLLQFFIKSLLNIVFKATACE